MKNSGFNIILFLAVFIVLNSSCKFRKIEKSDDWRVKYEAALQYYEDESYYKASVLFEQISPIVRGLPEGEKVSFYLAYCNFYQNLFLLAAHHFQSFFEAYGRSELVQEARYMYAYSLYASSPELNLDQTSSIEAIAAMQNFVNRYPTSEFYDEANEIIIELQKKLEIKGYQNAYQYYKMRIYSAAIVAFENFRLEYPGSEFNEKAEFYRIISMYEYAENSIITKQPERYGNVLQYYEDFIGRYPESDLIKEAEKVYIQASEKLNNFALK